MSDDMEVDEEEKIEEIKEDADPLAWRNIESLFDEPFKNSLTEHTQHGKVLLQTNPCICGYHTYFSMKNTIESLLTDNPTEKLYFHLRNKLRHEFWRDYEQNRKLLLTS
jgi:hypothetical protein